MLNNRQIELLEYLKANKDTFKGKVQICAGLPFAYPRHLENNNNEGNKSTVFKNLSNDVRFINNCDDIEFIIISSNKGFKIGNPEEVENYINKRFKRDLKALKLDWNLVKKKNLDKQLKMDEEVIKEVKAYMEE